mmetsp:Transcript_6543/g.8310  ORF Transcript_6543/g.8310 Transcript_6543/m.8310 type:complete len:173 (+) Transcript_6543:125-643(+)
MKPLHGVDHWYKHGLGKEGHEEEKIDQGPGLVIKGRQLPPGVMPMPMPMPPPRGPTVHSNYGEGFRGPPGGPMHPPRDNFGPPGGGVRHLMSPPRPRGPPGPPRGPPPGPGPGPGPQDRYIPGPMFPRGPPMQQQHQPRGNFVRPYTDPDAAPASEKPTEIKYRTVVDYSDL